ncbi:MAG: hypothetical protein FWG99_09450 [Treponema sp.]|nr:hypothetical protein [Treponema sp.]
MDTGQIVFISSRLILGAAATFLAIMLWAKMRDMAWMLMVIGTIVSYIEIIYSILDLFGFIDADFMLLGSVPWAAILLPSIRMIFFIAAFYIMVINRRRS